MQNNKYTLFTIFIVVVGFYILHISYAIYEEYKVKQVVENIFKQNNFDDIKLIVCHEEKCLYDFGKGKEYIDIYTVGRKNIESRIQLAREIAIDWPSKSNLCKTFYQNSCLWWSFCFSF